MILTNQAYAYWLVPLNTTGIPGQKSVARTVNSLGPDGTTDDGVAGIVTYTPVVLKYGIITLTDIAVQDNRNVQGITELFCASVYVDETDLGKPVTMGAVDGTTDPIPFTPGDSGIGIGDFVVWNDPAETAIAGGPQGPPVTTPLTSSLTDTQNVMYVQDPTGYPLSAFDVYFNDGTQEGVTVIGGFGTSVWQITRGAHGTPISSHTVGTLAEWYPPPAGSFTCRSYECNQVIENPVGSGHLFLQRHYPPDPRTPIRAYFETFRVPHLAGIQVFKLKVQHDSLKTKFGGPQTGPNGLPVTFPIALQSACVVATLLTVGNYYGYGPFTTYPLASPLSTDPKTLPPAPGLRTLNGSTYTIPVSGVLAPGTDVSQPLQIDVNESIRCIYAAVKSPPSGGADVINVKLRPPASSLNPTPSYQLLEQLTIAGGATFSYDPTSTNTPADRATPYGAGAGALDVAWPFPTLFQQATISIDVVSVGTVSGVDLLVYLGT